MTRLTVWSPQRRNRRIVDVYLPPSYGDARRRYPVVYMQDGQNLADPATAFAGTWQLDEVLHDLSARGIEPIVVGIFNTPERLAEYSPFPDRRHGGGAASAYVSFVADTLKPRIDRMFRTRRQAASTAIVGSSMGGLLSVYAWFHRPDVFSHVAALSPSLWYGRERLFQFFESTRLPRGRIHLDVGTAEGPEALRDVRAFRRLLEQKGIDGRLSYGEDRGAKHEEAAWSQRLGPALEFLLED